MAKPTTRGSRRAEIKKIQNEEQLQAAFSRRRLALFKQANEMSILTGAQVALIVFSPSNRVFSFGCPDVQFVIDRYENQRRDPGHHGLVQSSQTNQERLARELSLIEDKVESEKKRGKMLDQMIEDRKEKYWWEAPIEDLELNQLEKLLRAKQALHDDVTKKFNARLTRRLNADQVSPNSIASLADDFIQNAINTNGSSSTLPPRTMDLSQNASIPYLINGFSSLAVDDGSSNALPHFDSEKSGIDSVGWF